MDTTNNNFATQAKKMRDDFVAAATAEADRWLEATLSMLTRFSQSGPKLNTLPDNAQSGIASEPQKGNGKRMSVVARRIIGSGEIKKRFNTVELRHKVEIECGPIDSQTQRANLANLLRRMVKAKELEIVSQGKGSRPSVYRIIE
ncbi:MAG: hypothetical protein JXM79_20480 [Sedimentisphaerales bacterium]|nr:hypothetical protein [Sedimentisphaerales bacterium]